MQTYSLHLPVHRGERQSDRDSGCLVKRHCKEGKKSVGKKCKKDFQLNFFLVGSASLHQRDPYTSKHHLCLLGLFPQWYIYNTGALSCICITLVHNVENLYISRFLIIVVMNVWNVPLHR